VAFGPPTKGIPILKLVCLTIGEVKERAPSSGRSLYVLANRGVHANTNAIICKRAATLITNFPH